MTIILPEDDNSPLAEYLAKAIRIGYNPLSTGPDEAGIAKREGYRCKELSLPTITVNKWPLLFFSLLLTLIPFQLGWAAASAGSGGGNGSFTAAVFSGPVLYMPLTNATSPGESTTTTPLPAALVRQPPGLADFAAGLVTGVPGQVTGIYVDGVLALRVVSQPPGDPGYISSAADTATEFQSATGLGVLGLLAHNYLAGASFFQLAAGQDIYVAYGDGSSRSYRVVEIADFERLTNGDLRSDFRDLDSGAILSTDQVFDLFYTGGDHLTLQTCLERDGLLNWGVRFIVAEPGLTAP